jgi:hypothetical protein
MMGRNFTYPAQAKAPRLFRRIRPPGARWFAADERRFGTSPGDVREDVQDRRMEFAQAKRLHHAPKA